MFFKYTADAYAYALMPGESGEHLRHLPQPGQVRQGGPLPKQEEEGEVPQEEGAENVRQNVLGRAPHLFP